MSELKLAASQPAITVWLSGALETLIQLETGHNVAQGAPDSGPVLKEYQTDNAVQSAMMAAG